MSNQPTQCFGSEQRKKVYFLERLYFSAIICFIFIAKLDLLSPSLSRKINSLRGYGDLGGSTRLLKSCHHMPSLQNVLGQLDLIVFKNYGLPVRCCHTMFIRPRSFWMTWNERTELEFPCAHQQIFFFIKTLKVVNVECIFFWQPVIFIPSKE